MNFTSYEPTFLQPQNYGGFNASPFDTASENKQEQNSDNAPVDNKQTDEGSKPDLTANLHIKSWDGTPLQENIIYNLNDMYGLPIARIKENRDAEKRAKASRKVCRENGMGQPAKLINARVIYDSGFTPEHRNENGEWVEVAVDQLDNYYGIMDGHGRYAGYLLDLEAAALIKEYEPLKFIFWYQNITTDVFKKQFPSLNFDTVKTKTSDLAKYSSAMYKNTQTALYTNLLDDKYIDKAAQIWIFGKELSRDDRKKVNGGETVTVDEDFVKDLTTIRKIFETELKGNASAKVLHSVPVAKWGWNKLKSCIDAEERSATIKQIQEKFHDLTTDQLIALQDAKGEKGNIKRTTEIVVHEILNEIYES